jgi:hypothetical protein
MFFQQECAARSTLRRRYPCLAQHSHARQCKGLLGDRTASRGCRTRGRRPGDPRLIPHDSRSALSANLAAGAIWTLADPDPTHVSNASPGVLIRNLTHAFGMVAPPVAEGEWLPPEFRQFDARVQNRATAGKARSSCWRCIRQRRHGYAHSGGKCADRFAAHVFSPFSILATFWCRSSRHSRERRHSPLDFMD